MRDGVRLATDVHLPDVFRAALPTVLIRLPYDKSGRSSCTHGIARYLTEHGFAVVLQDVRGKFRSEGEAFPFLNEATDGSDTLDWIVAQSWSSGAVGMLGDSYYGFTQWAAAATRHPALRAMVVRKTGSLFMREFDPGRPLKVSLADWVVNTFSGRLLYEDTVLAPRPAAGWDVVPEPLEHSRDMLRRLIDGVGSRRLAALALPGGVTPRSLSIPALHSGGWFDIFSSWQLDDWRLASVTAHAALHQFLRMDTTDHEDFLLAEDGAAPDNHKEDDAALQRYLPRLLDEPVSFLHHYLSASEGRWKAPRVQYRVAYGTRRDAVAWPPAGARRLTLYLGEKRLLEDPPPRSSTLSWLHDPWNPVPFLPASEWTILADRPDESSLCDRPDVITFTSEPRVAPLELLGPVALDLTISAASQSTHVIARLLDVADDGRSTLVVDGAAWVATARGARALRIALRQTAYRVHRGHCLRLVISTSSFPQYFIHPGTDDEPLTATIYRAVGQRLIVGGADGGALRLTVRD